MATLSMYVTTHTTNIYDDDGRLAGIPSAGLSRLSADFAAEYHPLRFAEIALPDPPVGPQHTCELPPPTIVQMFHSWLTTDTSETFDEYVLRAR